MQRIGAFNSDLYHCFANLWGGPVKRNEAVWIEQGTILLPGNCPFEVFVAFLL